MTAFNKQMETLPTTSEFQDMDLYLQIINADHLRLPLFCIMYMYLIISHYVALAYSSDEKRVEWGFF